MILGQKVLINMLDLKRPIYQPTAAYGHFGRTDIDLSWEKTIKLQIFHNKYLINKGKKWIMIIK